MFKVGDAKRDTSNVAHQVVTAFGHRVRDARLYEVKDGVFPVSQGFQELVPGGVLCPVNFLYPTFPAVVELLVCFVPDQKCHGNYYEVGKPLATLWKDEGLAVRRVATHRSGFCYV